MVKLKKPKNPGFYANYQAAQKSFQQAHYPLVNNRDLYWERQTAQAASLSSMEKLSHDQFDTVLEVILRKVNKKCEAKADGKTSFREDYYRLECLEKIKIDFSLHANIFNLKVDTFFEHYSAMFLGDFKNNTDTYWDLVFTYYDEELSHEEEVKETFGWLLSDINQRIECLPKLISFVKEHGIGSFAADVPWFCEIDDTLSNTNENYYRFIYSNLNNCNSFSSRLFELPKGFESAVEEMADKLLNQCMDAFIAARPVQKEIALSAE